MPWNPGADPFPSGAIKRITDFQYLDELHFVCHAKVHVKKTPKSKWQMARDFRVSMKVHPRTEAAYDLTLTVPRGMHTDLASVPKLFWSLVGPIGKHLEASIVHDYLYMAWTDFRPTAPRESDWDFADAVFRAGMKKSGVDEADIIYHAVHSPIGRQVFFDKQYTLGERMDEWLAELADGHTREG